MTYDCRRMPGEPTLRNKREPSQPDGAAESPLNFALNDSSGQGTLLEFGTCYLKRVDETGHGVRKQSSESSLYSIEPICGS